jgi:hypothetical protein
MILLSNKIYIILFSNKIKSSVSKTIVETVNLFGLAYNFPFVLQLLELPQFQDIIKIKTIGSTYMAASGLNPSRQVKVTIRSVMHSLCIQECVFHTCHFLHL